MAPAGLFMDEVSAESQHFGQIDANEQQCGI